MQNIKSLTNINFRQRGYSRVSRATSVNDCDLEKGLYKDLQWKKDCKAETRKENEEIASVM